MDQTRRLRGGYSLLEVLLAVALIALLAGLVMPGNRPVEQSRIDTAVALVREALEFARDEAVRTGEPYRVSFADDDIGLIKVERMDTTAIPPVPVGVTYHPVWRQPWSITVRDRAGGASYGGNKHFDYGAGGTGNDVYFDAFGVPHLVDDAGDRFLLVSAGINFKDSLNAYKPKLLVDAETGRVHLE